MVDRTTGRQINRLTGKLVDILNETDIVPPRKENITQSESQETTNGEETQQDEELEQNNEQDQDLNNSVDIPLFRTEEGRYLASALGDPLIKGLTEVANKRPKDPISFLATYLYNFDNQNKSRVKTTESAVLVTGDAEAPGNKVENPGNDQGAPHVIEAVAIDRSLPENQQQDDTDAPETAVSSEDRDEHGQSMLHFAAARSHGRGALFQLLQESGISPAYRDELYRTARDVSVQAGLPENTKEIDRFIIHLAARGEVASITALLVEGYDHILDIVDENEVSIIDVVQERDQPDMLALLNSVRTFEVNENL
ncbi:uncharacterized protein LOC113389329 [Ctenocephalides felis]|uniref:uncharacterized protein LOC113389329 n=1 Tax=Ctenocephalides felis TaxID=7515 RepID=UPI000E6E41F0|nr:uncharacterized protein LOC113389329 [Ctenocephalides felis]